MKLLRPGEPGPVSIRAGAESSPFVFAVDHASRRLPATLGSLGLSEAELRRHIAWDIGARGLAEKLAERFDAPCFFQEYSRLVIDANRPPGVPSSIVETSEATVVPGNRNLTDAERRAREEEIFWPYHRAIAREIEEREQRAQPIVLVTVHSFTPIYHGEARVWDAGVLYHPRDGRLAVPLLAELRKTGREIGDNEPYAVSDDSDYGLLVHGERRGHWNVELEVRQDHLETEAGQLEWARLVGVALEGALVACGVGAPARAPGDAR